MIEIIETKKIKRNPRRSKTNFTYHEDIPRIPGRKTHYKQNKNCKDEHINMVRKIEEKKLVKEKYDVESKGL